MFCGSRPWVVRYHVLLAYLLSMYDRQPWLVYGTMPLFNPLLLTPHLATSYG